MRPLRTMRSGLHTSNCAASSSPHDSRSGYAAYGTVKVGTPNASAWASPSASRSAPTTTTRAGKSGWLAASSSARRFEPVPEMRTASVSTRSVYRGAEGPHLLVPAVDALLGQLIAVARCEQKDGAADEHFDADREGEGAHRRTGLRESAGADGAGCQHGGERGQAGGDRGDASGDRGPRAERLAGALPDESRAHHPPGQRAAADRHEHAHQHPDRRVLGHQAENRDTGDD